MRFRSRGVALRGRMGGAAADSLLTALVAHYRLDDNLTDSSGNGRDLTDASAVFTVGGDLLPVGVLGFSLKGGSGSVADLSVAFSDLTLSFWVWLGASGGTATHAVSESGGDTLSAVCVSNTRVVTVTPLGQSPVATAALSQGVWHHVAAVCESGVLALYADGVVVAVGVAPAASVITGWTVAGTVRARADEWCIASRAWSPAEVLRLYNSGAGFDPTA